VSAPAASPFGPRTVIGMLVFGALAFIAMLYFIGAGETGGDANNGGGHAAGRGLNGFAAFAQLLGKEGYQVSLSRNVSQLSKPSLLVLTPPQDTDVKELNRIISGRRYAGPTIVILPKWFAARAPSRSGVTTKQGWVVLVAPVEPKWAVNLLGDKALAPGLKKLGEGERYWNGLGINGTFPDADQVLALRSGDLVDLVTDGSGRTLAGYWNDGAFPALAGAAGVEPREMDDAYEGLAPVVVIAEPDLVDNYGLADRNRAMLALALVRATMGDAKLPVVFDLTLDGLGASRNLLTLAFKPPFLAATLCLLVAALVVGWRAFRRFGPPLAEAPVFAFGKRQLAVNGAALIQRSGRLHLLASPYAAIERVRLARLAGLNPGDDPARVEGEIDRVLEARGLQSHAFSRPAEALRGARRQNDLLREAHALKELERILAP
jgi:hypothetical protein